jgi:hypothetical protein
LVNRNILIISASVLVGLTSGFAGGYLFAKTQIQKDMEERLGEEIEATKEFYGNLHQKEYLTPEDAVAALIPKSEGVSAKMAAQAVRVYQGDIKELNLPSKDVEEEKKNAESVLKNIFATPPPEGYLGPERRDPGRPYVIAVDDYMSNDTNYTQVTLTYYAGDQVLVDERDEPIELIDQTVGGHEALEFGVLSEDENMVYIRNESLETDFEIAKSEGKYSEEVLGLRSS